MVLQQKRNDVPEQAAADRQCTATSCHHSQASAAGLLRFRGCRSSLITSVALQNKVAACPAVS